MECQVEVFLCGTCVFLYCPKVQISYGAVRASVYSTGKLHLLVLFISQVHVK